MTDEAKALSAAVERVTAWCDEADMHNSGTIMVTTKTMRLILDALTARPVDAAPADVEGVANLKTGIDVAIEGCRLLIEQKRKDAYQGVTLEAEISKAMISVRLRDAIAIISLIRAPGGGEPVWPAEVQGRRDAFDAYNKRAVEDSEMNRDQIEEIAERAIFEAEGRVPHGVCKRIADELLASRPSPPVVEVGDEHPKTFAEALEWLVIFTAMEAAQLATNCEAVLLSERSALQARIGELEGERDEYRDLLRDLVMVDAEEWAIGGGPGFTERKAKAWAAARERFEP